MGNHRFSPWNIGLSCKCSLKPIHLRGFEWAPTQEPMLCGWGPGPLFAGFTGGTSPRTPRLGDSNEETHHIGAWQACLQFSSIHVLYNTKHICKRLLPNKHRGCNAKQCEFALEDLLMQHKTQTNAETRTNQETVSVKATRQKWTQTKHVWYHAAGKTLNVLEKRLL